MLVFVTHNISPKECSENLPIATSTTRPVIFPEIDLRSPVLDAGGKSENLQKNLRKQVWTGNQMHVQHWDRG